MRKFTTSTAKALFCIFLLCSVSCLKKTYEGPPDTSGYDPELTITTTIAALTTMPQNIAIPDDITIAGIVIMDDRNGNYYNKIVIEDTSGGIEVLLDQSSLYNDYPVGRKLYIKCKGLFLGNFGDNPQLGYTPDNTGSVSNIPSALINDFVVKANHPNVITPDTLSIAQLSDTSLANRYLNTLVAIKAVEFADANLGASYAQPGSIASATSLAINDCNGYAIMLRTSGFAKFQPYFTPVGNGTIVGIFTKYKNELQLYIRDTTDVNFYGDRCNGGSRILLQQDFSSLTDNAVIALTDWYNFSEIGDKKFTKGVFQSDVYAKISAYGGTVPPVVRSWLITPSINLTGKTNAKLTFKTKDGFDNGATLKAYISTNYAGDPTTASWTDLEAIVSTGHATSYATEWTIANVDLNYNAPVYIAFKYEGGGTKTTTYELGYIKVTAE